MEMNRRHAVRMFFAGATTCAIPLPARTQPANPDPPAHFGNNAPWRHFELENGFRTHVLSNDSGYVSASLLLRSDQITFDNGGLAHIMEHTSFVGAAGGLVAKDLKNLHQDVMLESDASTTIGAIEWNAAFLPQSLAEALHILGVTSLEQQFDEATVASESKVVLQELYLDKFEKAAPTQQRFERALFGKGHPYARDTVNIEIAKAKTPPAMLAAELKRYAASLKLPANMDLFLAGDVDLAAVEAAVRKNFGRHHYAKGKFFDLPRVHLTGALQKLAGPCYDLSQPMCEVAIAWNTGVCIADSEARVLLALREYVDHVLSRQLREIHGETYTPEVEYEPDLCSGAFKICITSSSKPDRVERLVFNAIESIKLEIDEREIARFKNRVELKRRKGARDNKNLIERMVERTCCGVSSTDHEIDAVTSEELLHAARKHLPSRNGAYIRLALYGQ